MEKENKEVKEKKSKLTPKQKELIITIAVLLVATIVGFFIGKWLFDALHG